MAELRRVEADGEVRLDRCAGDFATGGVNAGGDVAGDDRRAAGVDRRNRAQRRLARLAGEAGAEDRVDDRARVGQPRGQVAADVLRREALQIGGRIAAQFLARPEEQRLDLESRLGQIASGDQAVAGVVPLAADDPHRAVQRQFPDRLSNRPSGRLHQLQRGDPHLLDRPTIDRAHPFGVVERIEPGLHRLSLV